MSYAKNTVDFFCSNNLEQLVRISACVPSSGRELIFLKFRSKFFILNSSPSEFLKIALWDSVSLYIYMNGPHKIIKKIWTLLTKQGIII